jgi:hypothetical protein
MLALEQQQVPASTRGVLKRDDGGWEPTKAVEAAGVGMEAASQTVSLSALVGATQRRILVLHCNGARPTSSNTLWATTRMALAVAYIFKSTHFILTASPIEQV